VALSVPLEVRTRFKQALEETGTASLASYLAGHPESRLAIAPMPTRAEAREYLGVGTRAVALTPPAVAGRGGRVTVILLTARSGAVEWSATRTAAREHSETFAQEVGAARIVQTAGFPVDTMVRYSGAPPTRLTIAPQSGVRWDALVVFSD
jgi:hypothetical protein